MRTIRTKVYKFDELTKAVQQKVIENNYDINVYYDWYEFTYEDAKNVGLKISGFDIDRGSYCNLDFIESAEAAAHLIIDQHGETCETYKTAESYLKERDKAIDTAPKDENGDFENERELDEKLDELDEEFKKSISEDYLKMLRDEYEYQTSEEAIKETISVNEYEFTAEGKMI